jgi:hypothetical protein
MSHYIMDLHDQKILELLKILHLNKSISQRELARLLKVSLGSINAYLKELGANKLILNDDLKSRTATYYLTEEGLKKKRKLNLQHWHETMDRLALIQAKIEDMMFKMKERAFEKIAFYGATYVAEIAYLSLLNADLHFAGIFDEEKAGERFLNHRVLSPEKIESIHFNKILVTNLSENMKEIKNEKITSRIENDLIYIDF